MRIVRKQHLSASSLCDQMVKKVQQNIAMFQNHSSGLQGMARTLAKNICMRQYGHYFMFAGLSIAATCFKRELGHNLAIERRCRR
jgi:hypothetical protein